MPPNLALVNSRKCRSARGGTGVFAHQGGGSGSGGAVVPGTLGIEKLEDGGGVDAQGEN